MQNVVIIGGGLAGLVSAIHLGQAGLKVTLIEQKRYPFNKVCGEYVSREIVPYLNTLGAGLSPLNPKPITHFLLSAPSGKWVKTPLPLGGLSISRHTLDHFLYEKAGQCGVTCYPETTVNQVQFEQDRFTIHCQRGKQFEAEMVLGCFGKNSILDRILSRPAPQHEAKYIGVKQYFEYSNRNTSGCPDNLVALHNFKGGYCGVSRIENNRINVAYLTTKKVLAQYGSLPALEENALYGNPFLKDIFTQARPVLPNPLVISNISFQRKALIENHMLMCGDAAGMIPPACGNGMAMAIHGAKMASALLLAYFDKKISRPQLEQTYRKQWNKLFRSRLCWGRHIQQAMNHPQALEIAVAGFKRWPKMLPALIKQTHGVTLDV